MVARRMRNLTFILILLLACVIGYTNCSRVPLTKDETVYSASGAVGLCVSNYTPKSYFFRNLNVAYSGNKIAVDTDADGLPDALETTLGMNPENRRSHGPILDSVCLKVYGGDPTACTALTSSCTAKADKTEYAGLNRCDLKALGALSVATDTPMTGWDTDLDSVPDFLELLSGTSPLILDNNSDPDSDGKPNISEISGFSNPNVAGAQADSIIVSALQKTDTPEGVDCTGGTYYSASLIQVPMLSVGPYTDLTTPNLSHDYDENVVLFQVVLSNNADPTNVTNGTKVITKFLKIKPGDLGFRVEYNELTSATRAAAVETF